MASIHFQEKKKQNTGAEVHTSFLIGVGTTLKGKKLLPLKQILILNSIDFIFERL